MKLVDFCIRASLVQSAWVRSCDTRILYSQNIILHMIILCYKVNRYVKALKYANVVKVGILLNLAISPFFFLVSEITQQLMLC